METTKSMLAVRGLSVDIPKGRSNFEAVIDVNFDLERGGSLALVGESGSGKTLTALAIAGLLAEGLYARGDVRLEGEELLTMGAADRRSIAGRRIGFIFQEPMSSLHPVLPIGVQIGEGLRAHTNLTKSQRRDRVLELLDLVGLGRTRDVANNRIGQLSGGMRQRVMIAMALSCGPELLIADEPTTALDVTLQRQVIDLMIELQQRMGLGLLMITHDLGVVRDTCQDVCVMYAGQIVERGSTETVFNSAQHPYTHALIDAIPQMDEHRDRLPVLGAGAPWQRDLRLLSADARPHSAMREVGTAHWVRMVEAA